MVHQKLKEKLFIYVFMVLLFLVIDCIINAIIYNQFFVKYGFLEIASVMILFSPLFLFKSHKFSIIYSSIIFAVVIIVMVINLLLNYASGDVFSIRYLFLFGEAAQVMSMQFINFWYIGIAALLVSILVLYFILVYRLFKFHFKKDETKKRYYPLGLSIFVMIIGVSVLFRVIGLNMVKSDNKNKEIYQGLSGNEILEVSSSTLKRGAIKDYGFFTYIAAELTSMNVSAKEKEEVKNYFSTGKIVNEEKSSDYSGICKDMNVVEIMIETGVDFMINETLTPNLYKLKNDGIDFTNNYSKNKTNISETIGIVGSVAKPGTTKDYNHNASLPKVLLNMGYETSYFHNNSGSFYDRKNMNKTMGFENSYFKEDIDPKETHNFIQGDYPLDSYYMNGLKSGNMNVLSDRLNDIDGIINKIIPEGDKKFYSFWTTMSTHGPYNTSKRNMKYYEDLGYVKKIKEAEANGLWTNICANDNVNYQNQIISLQSEFMDFDLALGTMIERLKELGKFENTLFVLFGDHETYYMSNNEQPLKYAVYDTLNPRDSRLFETTLIFYNPKLNQKYEEINHNTIYDKFSSPYVIVPTILDIMGVKYNENHYVSKSAFLVENELENIFYSHELQSIFTDKLYATTIGEYAYENNITDSYKDEFYNYSNYIAKRIKIFNRFYEKKLYSYVE